METNLRQSNAKVFIEGLVSEKDLTVKCIGCQSERIEAFQCTCGKSFCRNCYPDSFVQEEFGDTVEVTCPECGAVTLFV